MLFKVTKDLLAGRHFYREGMTISGPDFVHPSFEPLDEEAVKALKEIGVSKELMKTEAPKEEEKPSEEVVQPKKRGRPASKRQPY